MRKPILITVFAVLLILSGCGNQGNKTSDGKLSIITTVGMITDVVQRIGGDRVTVHGLMGPGVDPHLYKASEGDVARMSEADLIFYNGLHLEGAMSDVLEQMNRRVKTVAVIEGIDHTQFLSPEEFEGAHDPHVWFDVSMWMSIIEPIKSALMELDPDGIEYYENNSTTLMKEMEELNAYVKSQAERVSKEQRVLITAHDAFNYFGRAYGFEVRGLQGISTATEAGTGDVQNLVNFIVKRRIPAIFVESSVPPRTIEAVQKAVKSRGFDVQIGGELFSDAMGTAGTDEGTYDGMVRHNIDVIVKALLKEQSEGGDH